CVAAERATEAQFPVRMGADGVDLEALLTQLGSRGVLGVLVEGGPRTITGFLRSGVVDWIVLFIAPKLLGAGKTWVEDLGFQTLDAVLAVSDVSVQKLGSDLMVMARVPRPL
ncbi:MAG: riboflavin biosynthesis protein RibD, partial [Armatimonadetes bacterium]